MFGGNCHVKNLAAPAPVPASALSSAARHPMQHHEADGQGAGADEDLQRAGDRPRAAGGELERQPDESAQHQHPRGGAHAEHRDVEERGGRRGNGGHDQEHERAAARQAVQQAHAAAVAARPATGGSGRARRPRPRARAGGCAARRRGRARGGAGCKALRGAQQHVAAQQDQHHRDHRVDGPLEARAGSRTLKATMATPAAIRAAVWPMPQNAPRRQERSSAALLAHERGDRGHVIGLQRVTEARA